jgi:hypothetical protein
MDRRRTIFASTAALALAFDQLTKIWVRHALLPIYPRVNPANGFEDRAHHRTSCASEKLLVSLDL